MNNNNRGNNNRRRGRGNNRQQGGGQQLNRIDSRARGNAPQLLEKYRKLAQDAHLNGDRVTAEYYLQFADHYFRVLADQRLRQEEQRQRRDERWQEGGEEADDAGEFAVDSDFPTFEQPQGFSRRDRDDRPRRDDRSRSDERARGEDRPRGEERLTDSETRSGGDDAAPAETAPDDLFEPASNPFVRSSERPGRGLRPRRDDAARDDRAPRAPRAPRGDRARAAEAEPVGLDPASLPPSISAPRDTAVSDAEAEPKPRRRVTRRKAADDDAGEALESVG